MASNIRKNAGRKMSGVEKILTQATGDIGDLNFIYGSKELGSTEAGRYDKGPKGQKKCCKSESSSQ